MSTTEFEPIIISTLSGLEAPGDTISLAGDVDLESFDLGGHTFELADGLHYDVAVTNTGQGMLLTGLVRGLATTPCDRCLAPAQVDIAGEVSCYYLHEAPEVSDEDDEDYGLINASDGTIDIAQAIQGAVAIDLPYVVLCSEDCLGLCPTCGHNLNEGPCDCARKAAGAVDPMSPFAALAGFVVDEGSSAETDA